MRCTRRSRTQPPWPPRRDDGSVPVCSLTDNTQPSLLEPYASGGLSRSRVTRAAVPVEPGSQTESDQVTMVYTLEHR